MSHPANRPGLLRRWMGAAAPAHEADPADMGTVMGLEFTLDETPAGSAPQAAHRPPEGASRRSGPWWQRRRGG